jgi:hypothetical protein
VPTGPADANEGGIRAAETYVVGGLLCYSPTDMIISSRLSYIGVCNRLLYCGFIHNARSFIVIVSGLSYYLFQFFSVIFALSFLFFILENSTSMT